MLLSTAQIRQRSRIIPGDATAVARRLGSRGLSTRCTPTAVIHVTRPFSNTLRVPAPPPGTAKAEQAPAELATRLDYIGAQVRIWLLSRDDEMKAKALPAARVDDLTDCQALGSVDDGHEIHLCGVHDVRDAPDYLQLKRLEVTSDHESKLRAFLEEKLQEIDGPDVRIADYFDVAEPGAGFPHPAVPR